MRVGILASHPIQYQAPWFRELSKGATVEVFFALQPSPEQQGAGFGSAFTWDVDLLSGYEHRFLRNNAANPSTERFSGCDTPEIFEIISASHFDVFIVSGWNLKSYWQAIRGCRRAGVPVMVRGDSQLATPRSRVVQLAKEIVYPRLLQQFDGFLTVGQRNREYLRHYGVAEETIFFAPHFVDNDWFGAQAKAARADRDATRAKWGVHPDATVALFVGKFIPKKRPADLLLATARARDQGSEVVPVFVGAGELDVELRKLARELDLPARFEGFQNQTELPAHYVAADFLVIPSASETWGLVVNEAMACGLAAIVSNAVGCAPDLIEDGATGYDFPVGEIDALAERMLLTSKIPPATLEAALTGKLAIYSAKTCAENTLSAAAQLIERSRHRETTRFVR
jgi:glycosyltransferase involved in cell wall biosynthesis